MALPPGFSGHLLALLDGPPPRPPDSLHALHTIELYLDYTCPYARRTFETLIRGVIPVVRDDPALAPALQFVFRQLVQPWHTASACTHEAALAVLRIAPDKFWSFSAALFAAQQDFTDGRVVAEPPCETYRRLAAVASAVPGIDHDAVSELLRVPQEEGHHAGNAVTADLKLVTRMARTAGVHVTPTVMLDGVVQSQISSSWTAEQWVCWLKETVSHSIV